MKHLTTYAFCFSKLNKHDSAGLRPRSPPRAASSSPAPARGLEDGAQSLAHLEHLGPPRRLLVPALLEQDAQLRRPPLLERRPLAALDDLPREALHVHAGEGSLERGELRGGNGDREGDQRAGREGERTGRGRALRRPDPR